jgi:predicted dehydrogenase
MGEHSVDPVRLGFVGAGQHARSMLYPSLNFASGVELTAISTRTEESATKARSDFNVPCYVGYEGLLEDDAVEGVIVCVPGRMASEFSAAALAAGKHVLCETPAITCAEDATKVRNAMASSCKIFQVAFCLRYAPIYRKLKTLMDVWREEGEGGFCVDIRYYEWIHHFYNMAIYLSGEVRTVNAWKQGKSMRVVLEFENGDLGTIRSTAFENHAIPYEEVEATRADGMLRATDRSELHYYREPESISSRDMTFDTATGSLWRSSTSVAYNRLNTLYASGYAAEIEDFARCIRTHSKPISSVEDAAQTEAIRRAVAESAATGMPISPGLAPN